MPAGSGFWGQRASGTAGFGRNAVSDEQGTGAEERLKAKVKTSASRGAEPPKKGSRHGGSVGLPGLGFAFDAVGPARRSRELGLFAEGGPIPALLHRAMERRLGT